MGFAPVFGIIARRRLGDRRSPCAKGKETIAMSQIVYIVGAVVIVMAILAFLGLR